jgi:Ca2+-binding RTX toxin-like protein
MASSKRRPGRATLIVASVLALALGLAAVAVADTFTGSSGPDTINATDGDDTITTGRGNDTVNAGLGSDSVSLGAGTDLADASTPINPFGANTFAECLNDDDTVSGQGGPDTLFGGVSDRCIEFTPASDHDTLNGAGGADTIDVTDDSDDMFGDPRGSDVANGGRGNDTCDGDATDVFISCETVNIP